MNTANTQNGNSLFTESKTIVDSSRIIYTPSGFARTSLFHLQETGTLQALYPHTSKRSDMASFLFFTVISGTGKLQYDGQDYELQSGDCVFLDCRKTYAHSTGADLWRLKWVHFYGPNMLQIYDKYCSRGGVPVFRPKSAVNYIQKLDELYEIADSHSYVRDMEIHTKLSELLVLLMKDAWQEREEKQKDSGRRNYSKTADIDKVKEYLDAHFTDKIALDNLASIFYINKFYLLKLFKRCYGTTINDYVISCRITKAKQLLRFSGKTMEEISCECGLGSAAYMNRLFRKIEGMSPGEYRKQWQGRKSPFP